MKPILGTRAPAVYAAFAARVAGAEVAPTTPRDEVEIQPVVAPFPQAPAAVRADQPEQIEFKALLDSPASGGGIPAKVACRPPFFQHEGDSSKGVDTTVARPNPSLKQHPVALGILLALLILLAVMVFGPFVALPSG